MRNNVLEHIFEKKCTYIMSTNDDEISRTQHINKSCTQFDISMSSFLQHRYAHAKKKKGKIDYLDGYYGMIKKREQVGVIEQ